MGSDEDCPARGGAPVSVLDGAFDGALISALAVPIVGIVIVVDDFFES